MKTRILSFLSFLALSGSVLAHSGHSPLGGSNPLHYVLSWPHALMGLAVLATAIAGIRTAVRSRR